MAEKDDGTLHSPNKDATTISMTSSMFDVPPPAHDPNLNKLATDAFSKISEYLQGELSVVEEDYKLLERMNGAATAKYTEMNSGVVNLAQSLKDLNEKYSQLQPYLDQIDMIDSSVSKLEQAAYKLDLYSRQLEAKFKQLKQ